MNLLTQKSLTLNGAFPIEMHNISDTLFNKTEIPAANGITNARSLARIYALLIGDINEDGQKKQRLINEKTLLQAVTSVTPVDEPDLTLFGMKSNFAKGGFHIYSDYFKAFGNGVFGHNGNLRNCRLSFFLARYGW
jgi:hypothetical protein